MDREAWQRITERDRQARLDDLREALRHADVDTFESIDGYFLAVREAIRGLAPNMIVTDLRWGDVTNAFRYARIDRENDATGQ